MKNKKMVFKVELNLSVDFGTAGVVPNDLVGRSARASGCGCGLILGRRGLPERVLDRPDHPRSIELEAARRRVQLNSVASLLLGHGLVALGEPRRRRDNRAPCSPGNRAAARRGQGARALGVTATVQYRHVEAVRPVALQPGFKTRRTLEIDPSKITTIHSPVSLLLDRFDRGGGAGGQGLEILILLDAAPIDLGGG